MRVDPFNWLLEGRLGLELEVGLLDFLTVQLTPVFVTNDKPPTLNLEGAPDVLRQESDGLGPIAGASLDIAFWLDGTAFHGYALRAGITNYGFTYRTEDDAGVIDELSTTERQAYFMLSSQSNWGAFALSGGIGLGIDLNRETRCFPQNSTSVAQATTQNCDDELQLATTRDTSEVVNLHGGLYPIDLVGRISLGVLFE